jgi:hypothetical protein
LWSDIISHESQSKEFGAGSAGVGEQWKIISAGQ